MFEDKEDEQSIRELEKLRSTYILWEMLISTLLLL